jgi:hypothetical protein
MYTRTKECFNLHQRTPVKRSYEKKVLNSDNQQFHQYQQNEQSPLTITH